MNTFTASLLAISLLCAIGCTKSNPNISSAEEKIVNIYSWHTYVPDSLIKKFEEETGIKVFLDLYDSNDVLEAKLLTGQSGYDIVFPSSWPYLARQVPAQLYEKLDKAKILNYSLLDPELMRRLRSADPDNNFAVPFLWGLTGFAYNIDKVKKLVPNAPVDSWAMYFDPNVVSKLSNCGVMLLEEPNEALVPAMMYLGINPESTRKEDLDRAIEAITKVRPFITRFDATRSNNEIAVGNACLVEHWLGSIAASHDLVSDTGKQANIALVMPKEGTLMWIDTIAIPAGSPHINNAHKFIDFILRPKNIAEVTNYTFFPNGIKASIPFVLPKIRDNKALYPDEKTLRSAVLHSVVSPRYIKVMSRAMTKVRTGR